MNWQSESGRRDEWDGKAQSGVGLGMRQPWGVVLEEWRSAWSRRLRARWPEVPSRMVEGAVGEALSLAMATGVPELVFPVLAEEKCAAVVRWHARQRMILGTTASFFAA